MKPKVEVLLDSSFLMLPSVKRINLLSELDRVLNRGYKLVTLPNVVRELEKLASQGDPGVRRRAKLALELLRGLNVEVLDIKIEGGTDKAIVESSKGRRWVVATVDRELRAKLRRMGVPTIYLRGEKRLELEGEVLDS
ncbi:MAG: 30S processome protein Utp24 [Thermoprotei archaeon]|nr:MAG: 30S processome protein Utp24 [Thermoprotei archaeon]